MGDKNEGDDKGNDEKDNSVILSNEETDVSEINDSDTVLKEIMIVIREKSKIIKIKKKEALV